MAKHVSGRAGFNLFSPLLLHPFEQPAKVLENIPTGWDKNLVRGPANVSR